MGIRQICGEPVLVPATDRRIMLINSEGCPWRGIQQVTC